MAAELVRCPRCNEPLREIDRFGERLVGCIAFYCAVANCVFIFKGWMGENQRKRRGAHRADPTLPRHAAYGAPARDSLGGARSEH